MAGFAHLLLLGTARILPKSPGVQRLGEVIVRMLMTAEADLLADVNRILHGHVGRGRGCGGLGAIRGRGAANQEAEESHQIHKQMSK